MAETGADWIRGSATTRPRVTWARRSVRSVARLPAGHPLPGLVRNQAGTPTPLRRGRGPRERGAPYGSDLRLYAAAGVPTLQYGPGDVRLAHGPNESVPIEEVAVTSKVLALALQSAPQSTPGPG